MKFDFEINDINYYHFIDYNAIPKMAEITKAVYIAEIDNFLESEFAYIEPEFATITDDPIKGMRYDCYDTLKRFKDELIKSMRYGL